MQARSILPLLDLVFLSLGAILACMTEMERVEFIPVELARVGREAVAVKQGDFETVTVSPEGIFVNEESVTREDLPGRLQGREVVLRGGGEVPTKETLGIVSVLIESGINVSLGVESQQETDEEIIQ